MVSVVCGMTSFQIYNIFNEFKIMHCFLIFRSLEVGTVHALYFSLRCKAIVIVL